MQAFVPVLAFIKNLIPKENIIDIQGSVAGWLEVDKPPLGGAATATKEEQQVRVILKKK